MSNPNGIRQWEKRSSPGIDLRARTPGAREYIILLAGVLAFLLIIVGISTYIIVQAMKIGSYGQLQVQRSYYVILIVWLFLSIIMSLIAAKVSYALSQRIAGPIKRIERALDRLINDEDAVLVLREKDALFRIAEKINRLVERQKKKGLRA